MAAKDAAAARDLFFPLGGNQSFERWRCRRLSKSSKEVCLPARRKLDDWQNLRAPPNRYRARAAGSLPHQPYKGGVLGQHRRKRTGSWIPDADMLGGRQTAVPERTDLSSKKDTAIRVICRGQDDAHMPILWRVVWCFISARNSCNSAGLPGSSSCSCIVGRYFLKGGTYI